MVTNVKRFARHLAILSVLSICPTILFWIEQEQVTNYIYDAAPPLKNIFSLPNNWTAENMTLQGSHIALYIYPLPPALNHSLMLAKQNNRTPGDTTLNNCSQVYQQPHLMRITDAIGRLGNNIFRLINLLAIAKKYCYLPVLKKERFPRLQRTFDLSILGDDPKDRDEKQWQNFTEGHCCRYNNKVEQLNTAFNWTLLGYLQTWRYAAGEETYLRSTLQFHKEVLKQVNTYFHNLRTVNNIIGNTLFVGVHVRRGDFVGQKNGYITATPAYLNKSMQFFREKFSKDRVVFIVASDDMNWVKTHTKGEDVYYTEQSESVDFAILSKCKHSIITAGSYGYLAAWFSGGLVVYCSDFPRPNSQLYKEFNITDYYPPHWLPMTND